MALRKQLSTHITLHVHLQRSSIQRSRIHVTASQSQFNRAVLIWLPSFGKRLVLGPHAAHLSDDTWFRRTKTHIAQHTIKWFPVAVFKKAVAELMVSFHVPVVIANHNCTIVSSDHVRSPLPSSRAIVDDGKFKC
jgi:hypothetical protein